MIDWLATHPFISDIIILAFVAFGVGGMILVVGRRAGNPERAADDPEDEHKTHRFI